MSSLDKMSYDQLIDSFVNSSKNGEKVRLLQEIENREAKEQNRDPAKVTLKSMNLLKRGNYIKNNITINKNESNFQQLSTYFHESRHAHQDYAVKTNSGLTEEIRNECALQNERTYIRANGDHEQYQQYLAQRCEADANFYAVERMARLCERYKTNENYSEQMKKECEKINKYHQIDEKCRNIGGFYHRQDIIHLNQATNTTKYYREVYKGPDKEQLLTDSLNRQLQIEKNLNNSYKPFSDQYEDVINKVNKAQSISLKESSLSPNLREIENSNNQSNETQKEEQQNIRRGGIRR